MKPFKNFINEEFDLINSEKLDALNEAKDDPSKPGGASNNTKGVLHELLTGYHLQGGKHMENHHLINDKTGKRETPKEAHDRLKASIHPDDYDKINKKAKSAADHIKASIEKEHPGHEISHVHHTSKPGDTEKETGVKASQKEDSSDIYITSKHKKTGKIMKHGYSLKVSDKSSKNVPSSSLGKESSGSKAKELHSEHKKNILNKFPQLKAKNEEQRREWAKNNPKKHEEVKSENRKFLSKLAHHHAAELQHKLDSGEHEHVINHIRDVLAAKGTPAQKAGKATFKKHTTYITSKGTQHHTSNPADDHEHILSDHKNITVKSSGGSVHFYHKGKKFASQAHKFDSQSDPLSSLKSAGKAT